MLAARGAKSLSRGQSCEDMFQARLLSWENIVRGGRARGLGMTMITQRKASPNKHVLTQAQALVTTRMSGAHDHAAIADCLTYQGDSEKFLACRLCATQFPPGEIALGLRGRPAH